MKVGTASLLSLNGHISSNFDIIDLKLSTNANFTVLFRSMWSKHENSKIDIHDVITSVLYRHDKRKGTGIREHAS